MQSDDRGGRRSGRWRGAIAALLLAALALAAAPAAAQLGGLGVHADATDEPVLFEADEMVHERETDIVRALGNVEISQGPRILLADSVSFNRRTGIVVAEGNVTLLEPTGEVIFADRVELADDLREGVIENIRIRLTDDARLAAAGGERVAGRYTTMRRAVYSPCDLCPDDPERAPLWQVKAERVIHDQEMKEVVYRDATLEIAGVPVFYTPFLSHPDPTVERRSGFLAPTFGSDSDLGLFLSTPYYWTFARNRDVTIRPFFMSRQLPVLIGEYRHLFPFGRLTVEASGGVLDRRTPDGVKRSRPRGHIKAEAEVDLDRTWRARGQLYQVTDNSYLRALRIDNEGVLRSNVEVEGFFERSYASIAAYGARDLRERFSAESSPFALPEARYPYRSSPKVLGSFVTFDTSMLALHRRSGVQTRRASVDGGWTLPLSTRDGQLISIGANLRSDIYQVENVPVGNREVSGSAGRFVPQVEANWRWPFVRPLDSGATLFVEPRVSAVAAPRGGNSRRIPNEDSLAFELDETNLFRSRRFPGLDRVEDGYRVSYGLGFGANLPQQREVAFFLGQSLRRGSDDTFQPGSGMDGEASDYVGSVLLRPGYTLDLSYRFALRQGDFKPRRNEVEVSVGPRWARVHGNYLMIDRDVGVGQSFQRREQFNVVLSSQFTNHWSGYARHLRDVTRRQALLTEIGLTYEDECTIFRVTARRDFFENAETRRRSSGDSIIFSILFKTLGEIQTSP